MTNWDDWGHLAARYRTPRPRKLLALDGGGIRGVVTLQILRELESQLREEVAKGRPEFRLCDYFDYIGGTSTGGIIAAGLARGMSVDELIDFYRKAGPEMFEKARLLRRLKNLYESGPLEAKLKEAFGAEDDLTSERLRCLLLVVTRNVTTDSPWPISTNPDAKYNARTRPDCNLRIPLWKLVRASTAAPVYFPPEVVSWDPNNPDKTFVFVDGGVTPYNNPALLLFRMATLPEYRLGWRTGEDDLLLVSVGTGAAANSELEIVPERDALSNLTNFPPAFMYAAMVDQDVTCRTIGRCVAGSFIDRELGDLVCTAPPGKPLGRAMTYARYNADLSVGGLMDLGLGEIPSDAVQPLDAVDKIDDLTRIGNAAAKKQVHLRKQVGDKWMVL